MLKENQIVVEGLLFFFVPVTFYLNLFRKVKLTGLMVGFPFLFDAYSTAAFSGLYLALSNMKE